MRIIRYNALIPQNAAGSVLALGNFDAVHRGHVAVLQQARNIAHTRNKPLAVMTFEPHPRRVFNPGLPPLRIVSFAEKARLLAQQGVEYLHVVRFTHEFAKTGAEEFVEDILHRKLRACHIVTGENFTFGYKRRGNPELLRHKTAQFGMEYSAVAIAKDEDMRENGGAECYSSTAIREALTEGNLTRAAKILGRSYHIRRRVVSGDKRGGKMGYPTANLTLGNLFCPRHGIYAVRVRIAESKNWLPAVASLGLRPMFALKTPLLEVHLFDFNRNIYGEMLEVEPVAYLREEAMFSSMKKLKDAIENDKKNARAILQRKESCCDQHNVMSSL